MKHSPSLIACLAGIAAARGFVMDLHVQTSSTPTAAELGKALGFTEADIPRIKVARSENPQRLGEQSHLFRMSWLHRSTRVFRNGSTCLQVPTFGITPMTSRQALIRA